MGNTANVHLQYKRWLGVEDGFFDGATISANDVAVWSSFASTSDPMDMGQNHIDKEWRFQDVDVSAQAAAATDGKMSLKFEIKGDDGLQFGGWTLDDVCLVVAHAPPASTCGDHQVGGSETCDDGNAVDGDGCSASCQLEDGTGDDDGGSTDTGCCSTSTNPAGAFGLSALALGLLLRRRKR